MLLLVFFRFSFKPFPLVSYQDVIDLLTPLVLIPIYWVLFRYGSNEKSKISEDIAFLILAVIWVQGQGMHLSSNSINNLIELLAKNQVIDIKTTDIYGLSYFFDEYLSHYLWHIGTLGLIALLIYREWNRPAENSTNWWLTVPGGLIYGFTYFCIFVEGKTVMMGLPFAVAVTAFSLLSARQKLKDHPILAFFFVSCLIASLLFTGWGLYWGDFPEFSKVGLI
jgi:hypothetical protein